VSPDWWYPIVEQGHDGQQRHGGLGHLDSPNVAIAGRTWAL